MSAFAGKQTSVELTEMSAFDPGADGYRGARRLVLPPTPSR